MSMFLSVLNISDRTIKLDDFDGGAGGACRYSQTVLPISFRQHTHKGESYTVQKPHIGRCPSHRVFRVRQVSQAIAALRLG